MPKLTSKGQVTIPRKIREHLQLTPSESVVFVIKGNHVIIQKEIKEDKIKKWFGSISLNTDVDRYLHELRGAKK